MASSLPTMTVVAGLIANDGQLLICQRRRDAAFAYKWEFPGGKIEPGETCEAGLQRELQEELGITAQLGPEMYRTRHDYPGKFSVELVFYAVAAYSGTLHNYAFEQIRWATPEHLPSFDFLDGDAELITLLSQGKLGLPQSQA